MASRAEAWPVPDDAPALEDLSRCVHCGLCLTACPTYLITGLEVESPRGRIYMARAVTEGRLEMTPAVQRHWDLCLQCRACEAVCPSGVAYGRIMEHTRVQVGAQPFERRWNRRLRRIALRHIIADRKVLGTLLAPIRRLAESPLRTLFTRSGLIRLLGPISRLERQLPAHVGQPVRPGDALPQPIKRSKNAVLFTGCVMGEIFGDVHRATARVLTRRGVSVDATVGQVCCGALHAHDGDLDFARKLARKNIDALESSGDAPIIVNSAGCGACMKEYGDLLRDDQRYVERAARFALRVQDASEYVAALGVSVPATYSGRYTYQDACHLAHAQRISREPRELLAHIAQAESVATEGQDVCCGAAGIYSLVEPEMSEALRSRKAQQFKEQGPDFVITANPGCQMQYEAAVRQSGIDARVMHIMEFLDRAETNAECPEH